MLRTGVIFHDALAVVDAVHHVMVEEQVQRARDAGFVHRSQTSLELGQGQRVGRSLQGTQDKFAHSGWSHVVGKKLEFDSKASGIGTITIQVSKKGETTDAAAEGTEGKDGQTDGTTTQGEGQGETSESQTGTGNLGEEIVEGYELAEDGYYYGPEGYYDADGTFYPY